MDGRRFDRWTRSFVGTSRRDAIKLLVAGLTIGPLAVANDRGAVAQVDTEACGKDGDRCRDKSDCCKDFKCKNEKCRNKDNSNNDCGKDGDRCNDNGDCCSNFKCKNDKCRDKESNSSCGKDGDRCKNNDDCCNSLRCKNEKCRNKN